MSGSFPGLKSFVGSCEGRPALNARFNSQGMPLRNGNLCVSDRGSLRSAVVSVILLYFEYVLNFLVRHVNHTRAIVSFMGTKAIVSLYP